MSHTILNHEKVAYRYFYSINQKATLAHKQPPLPMPAKEWFLEWTKYLSKRGLGYKALPGNTAP